MRTINDNQRMADAVADAMGKALRAAYPCAKRAGMALGVSGQQGRRWFRGNRSNPLFRIAQLIRRSPNPWAIIGPLVTVAIERELDLGGASLAEAWLAAHTAEARAGAAEMVVEAEFVESGDVDAVYHADAAGVSASLRRMALSLACKAQGVDPREAMG